jgi:hypothetical protein
MVTIETVATVTEEGTITAKVPGYLSQGEHRVVIVVEEPTLPRVPSRFPDLASFRASLGAETYPGNTILEMREDERP